MAQARRFTFNSLTIKQREPSKDFGTLSAAGNNAGWHLWSDGTTMWVTNRDDAVKIYAYNLASKQREPVKDFDTLVVAGNEHPRGLWSDGTTMWVSDPWDDKIYAYRQPPAPSGDNALKALSLSRGALSPAQPTTLPAWSQLGLLALGLSSSVAAECNKNAKLPQLPSLGVWRCGLFGVCGER